MLILPSSSAQRPACGTGACCCSTGSELEAGVFRGAYLETDYASFAAWSRWGWPPAGVYDCFGAGAILGSDGGFLLGVMSRAHAQCRADLFSLRYARPERHRRRYRRSRFQRAPRTCRGDRAGGCRVRDRAGMDHGRRRLADLPYPGVSRRARPPRNCGERALAHLAREAQPELADIRIARGPADFDPKMRGFVRAFLGHRWRER